MIQPYYEEDGITIYNADCRDVLPQLGQVDLVLTDPPYGLGKKMHGGSKAWGHGFRQKGVSIKSHMAWDIPSNEIVASLASLPTKVVIWGGNYYPLPLSRGWLSWFKPDAVPTMAQFELAWTNQDQNAKQISHSIAATNAERVGHPTQKPLAVIKWSISAVRVTSGVVLDPFMGSGTTLRAAKDLGLRAIGIEIEKKYCDIAIERLRQRSLFAEVAA